jgi:dihydrodipicolinate synthase/N-acetylneuraminate lyase
VAIDRKDVRAKLDPDMHTMLKVLADADGVTEAQFIENILVPVIRQRVHAANVIAAKALLAGITGNPRETPGPAGIKREGGR